MYRQPKRMESDSSSKHGNSNKGATSNSVERRTSDKFQMEVSIGHNDETMGYQQPSQDWYP